MFFLKKNTNQKKIKIGICCHTNCFIAVKGIYEQNAFYCEGPVQIEFEPHQLSSQVQALKVLKSKLNYKNGIVLTAISYQLIEEVNLTKPMGLSEKEMQQFLIYHAKKCLLTNEAVSFDYEVSSNETIHLVATKQNQVKKLIRLFHLAKFPLHAIDVDIYALFNLVKGRDVMAYLNTVLIALSYPFMIITKIQTQQIQFVRKQSVVDQHHIIFSHQKITEMIVNQIKEQLKNNTNITIILMVNKLLAHLLKPTLHLISPLITMVDISSLTPNHDESTALIELGLAFERKRDVN